MKRTSRAKTQPDRKLSIEAFRALLLLSETGSVTATARKLGVTQPVISKRLQVFRDESCCGAILLRPSGSVELTEAGRSALPAIQELVARYDRILSFLRGEEVSPMVLKIATGSFAAEYFLPAAIARMRSELEDIQIETQVCRGRDRIIGTARGAFDLAIVTHDRSQIRQILQDERFDDSALVITSLGRHPMCALAHRETEAGQELLAMPEKQVIPLTQLANWELIGPDRQSGLRRQLERKLKNKALYWVAEGGGWSAAREYARQQLGVAIVPQAIAKAYNDPSLIFRCLSSEFDVTDSLIHAKENHRSHIQAVKKTIIACIREKRNPSN